MNNGQSNIIVSICCITYNHAPFIGKAIEGFLIQEHPTGVSANEPWYEILIHDDASTDGTIEIIKEYAAKYPDKIFPIYEKQSLFQNGRANEIDYCNYQRARGKYIAYCEGDDYWTDAQKLKKQVEWMEAHPDYSVTFHDFVNYNYATQQFETPYTTHYIQSHIREKEDGIDLSLSQFFDEWVTMPTTMLFRKDAYDPAWHTMYKNYRDTHEIYHLMKKGKCRILNMKGAVRIRHKGGLASMVPQMKQIHPGVVSAGELYYHNRDEETRNYYCSMLQWAMRYNKPYSMHRIALAWKYLRVTHSITQFIKDIKRPIK